MTRDFQGLGAALIGRAGELIPSWLPGGKLQGSEYLCSDLRGGSGDSFKVNIRTGKWADFAAADCSGGDLISLYAAINSLEQITAFDQLAQLAGFEPGDRPPVRKRDPIRSSPPPAAAPDPDFIHRDFGEATTAWVYRDKDGQRLFYVARYDPPGGKKQIVPWTWGQHTEEWVAKAWSAPRVLYQLDRLTANPDKPVMVVEGEKAADAAQEIVGDAYVVTTWSGGSQAIGKTDFSPLKGRKVILWPDADSSAKFPTGERKPYEMQPGPYAMAKVARDLEAEECKIINVREHPVDGWDAADALAEGWDMSRLVQWAKPRAEVFHIVKSETSEVLQARPLGEGRAAAVAGAKASASASVHVNVNSDDKFPVDGSMYGMWERLKIALSSNGMPIMNLDNVLRVLEMHPDFKRSVWYDTFHKRYFTGKPPREWSDADTLNFTAWLQRNLCFRRLSKETVNDAISHFAHKHERNEPLDWLDGLKWDGQERIAHAFEDCFGAAPTDYIRAVSKNFFVGMVARILKPGCQLDNMVVLEGKQGGGKTSALRIIGGSWYTEAHESVTSNDFFMVLHGKMLVEIAELDSFNRAEVTRIKQVITSTTDRFRSPYARTAVDHPRMSIFVGTTNEDSYLRDNTGGRRFWPVKCGAIDLDTLASQREQYFAEAVHLFKRGESWWKTPEQAREEQEERRKQDEWEIIVAEWLNKKTGGGLIALEISTLEVATDALGIDREKLDIPTQHRIGGVLRVLGYEKTVVRIAGRFFKVWKKKVEVSE